MDGRVLTVLCLLGILALAFSSPVDKENAVHNGKTLPDKESQQLPPHLSFLNSTRQKSGYVDVRPNAHKFWWLFYSTHPAGYENRPLVMWLQGGPGAGGSGFGVFDIIGPFDMNGNTREFSWVQEVNLIFVDNPVGSGFSYVDTPDAYTTDVDQIGVDLTELFKEFLRENPEFKTAPFYIFGQSYGGKMAAAAIQKMHQEVEAGVLDANLKGFAMGNAWIHPVDSTMTWGPLLYWMSNTDEPGLARIQTAAQACKDAADAGEWQRSTDLWRNTQRAVNAETNYVDFYNILKYRVFSQGKPAPDDKDAWIAELTHPGQFDLFDFMNTMVKEHLGIIPEGVSWGGQRSDVFRYQEVDFMKDVVGIVDDILQTTDLQVIVYQGQLDLICDTIGALNWVQRLTWDGMADYNGALKKALVDPETKQTDTFVKAHENFKFYWILRSGHSAPGDSEFAGLRMLKRIIDDEDR